MISDLVTAVGCGAIDAAELVTEATSRVTHFDKTLNAVTAVDPARALEEAQRIDALDTRRPLALPLAGMPLLVKDVHDVAGTTTTFGSVPFDVEGLDLR